MACEGGPLPPCGPSPSTGGRAAPVLCGLGTEPQQEWQLHGLIPSSYSHMFTSQQILQRRRFLCVHTLNIKVLRGVFSSGRNHQRHSWTPPLRSLKLSAARSWGSQEMKQFRHRNQEPMEGGGDWAGPSRTPVLLPSHSCVMKRWDSARQSWHHPPPPSHQAPNVWITHSCFLLMNGEETQLKNKAERSCRSQRCQTDHTAAVKHPNGHLHLNWQREFQSEVPLLLHRGTFPIASFLFSGLCFKKKKTIVLLFLVDVVTKVTSLAACNLRI